MKRRMMIKSKCSPRVPRVTMMLLMASLFPAGVLAAWSNPGQDFTGELTLDGEVTSVRNPWAWQVDKSATGIQVKATTRQARDGDLIWQGLMKDRPLLLGKTVLTTPAGREGLAPVVSLGGGQADFSLTPEGDGILQVKVPVFAPEATDRVTGSLQFRVETAALIRYVVNGSPVYAGMHNDLAGNGLPGKGLAMTAGRTAQTLCGMFAGEGPAWLCAPSVSVREVVPLSRFTDNSLRQVEGAYGAQVVGGSGTLRINGSSIPASWKATLPVRIEYR
ncbi:TPA: fimbrial protein [Salmonella enterica subsp. enterica serovar Havana]